VAEIALSGGGVALVDNADHAYLTQFRWRRDNEGYAVRTAYHQGVRYTVRMHRVVVQAPATKVVDHVNGHRLDNRRGNLRLVTPAQNVQNLRGARMDSSTGVRGVERRPSGRYRARVMVDGKYVELGTFDTIEEADAVAREARARLMTHSSECEEVAS
jgi:hypothetical protein